MRTPIIAANWKMYKNRDGAKRFINHLRDFQLPQNVDVVIAPPFVLLDSMHGLLGESQISLAGQNLYPASEGPYTGEISSKMLRELGCRYVIVGHSERRQHFGESDQFVSQKVLAALGSGRQATTRRFCAIPRVAACEEADQGHPVRLRAAPQGAGDQG